jgi:hypothetical protein
MKHTGSRPRKDPTPEEIAAEAAKIRAEWPEHRWAKELPEEPPVQIPVVKLDKRHNGVLM